MTTLKSINSALPRFDVLRKYYMLHAPQDPSTRGSS